MEKKKLSNIELLRIISMIMIIVLHFLSHGGVLNRLKIGTSTYYFLWILEGISYVAVNIYVLISGYFLCKSKFKFKKIVDLALEALFYSVLIYVILVVTKLVSFNIKDGFKILFPIINNQYWFVTRYIVMYIFSPFLNIFINAMNKKQHLGFIILSTVFCCILRFVFYVIARILPEVSGTKCLWFMFLYITAAYIRNYYVPKKGNFKKYIGIYFVVILIVPLNKCLFEYLSTTEITNLISSSLLIEFSKIFLSYASMPVYVSSIMIFLAFLSINIKKETINNSPIEVSKVRRYLSICKERMNNLILKVSSLTFGVYLIHDNNYVRGILWGFLKPYIYLDKWYFSIYLIITVTGIFAICIGIEYMKRLILSKIFKGKVSLFISNKIEKMYDNLVNGINHLDKIK